MAVPTAVATSIRYKGVDYPFGTPIVFTELKPFITINFDGGDATGSKVITRNDGVQYVAGFVQHSILTEMDNAPSSHTLQLNIVSDTDELLINATNSDGLGTTRTWTVSSNLATGTNDSWQTLGATVLRDTLLVEMEASDLATLLQGAFYKIAWEGVDETWTQPYLITQIITGGDLNSSQLAYAEMLWRVVVHTESLPVARDMQNAIHKALTRVTPTVNFTGVFSAGEIEEVTPVTDRYQVENVPLYVSGGIYRLRLAKG